MNEDFTHRILRAEVKPPDFIWGRIAEQLDAGKEKGFVLKLAEAEILPPVTAWENIQAALYDAPVISIERKWVKYAAAAAIVGIVLISGFFFLNNRSTSRSVASTEKSDSNANSKKVSEPAAPAQSSDDNTSASTQGYVSSATINRPQRVPVRSKKNSNIRYASVEPAETIVIADQITKPTQNVNESVPAGLRALNPTPDYYTVQAPNGQPVKVSARFSDAVNYFFTSDDKTDNSSWKARLEAWRNKLMSNPSFIPTGTNFLDILELKEMMKDQ